MPRKSSVERGYTTFSIPTGLMHKVEEVVKTGTYKNKTDFILEAIRDRLREMGALETGPTLVHINSDEDVVRIGEVQGNRVVAVAHVYFKLPNMVLCDKDGSDGCKHVDFAQELPEVQEILSKKGWKPK